MKTILHKAEDRGFANHGWLQANHSFSFASYYDPNKIQFGALRVLNDDVVAPKMGFSTHPHDNMEIITIPLKGALKHKDSMHNEWQNIEVGEVQVMSAGTGLLHSEMNASDKEYLSLFQIWILPFEKNVKPRYDQKMFDASERKNKEQVLVSSFSDKHEGSLKIHQNAKISRIDLNDGQTFEYQMNSKHNGVYVMNITGHINIGGIESESRDAVGIYETESFNIKANQDSQILFIEVPMV